MRKKKMIWWEQDADVRGADEARRRGESEAASHPRRTAAPYYGPVTVPPGVDTSARPDGAAAVI